MGSPMDPSDLTLSDLQRSKSKSPRVSVAGDLSVSHIFAGNALWISHKAFVEGRGVSAFPAGLLGFFFII